MGLVLAICCATLPTASAQDEVDRVLKAWTERQQDILSADFKLSGTVMLEPGHSQHLVNMGRAGAISYPDKETELSFKARLVIDRRRGGLHRDETQHIAVPNQEGDALEFKPHRKLMVFDGRIWNSFERRLKFIDDPPRQDGSQHQLAISEQARGIIFSVDYNPLLYCVGIVHPGLAFDWAELSPELRSADFRLKNVAEFAGHKCIVIETVSDERGHRKEFWVNRSDPRKIHQAIYYGLTEPDLEWLRIKIEYDAGDPDAIPSRWTIRRVNFATLKASTHTLKMDAATLNGFVPRKLLTVKPKPGTLVIDQRKPRELRYSIAD